MTNPQSPGISSRENPSGIPSIRNAATSIAAFVGTAERGPINEAVRIGSPEDFIRIFGGVHAGSYLLDSVNGFFENGGSECEIVRVAHYTDILNATTLTATKASTWLQTSAATATAAVLTSGNTETFNMGIDLSRNLQIAVDGGGVQDNSFTVTRPSITAANTETYALADGQTIIAEVNGVEFTATFNTADFVAIGTATALEVAAVLNTDILGASASVAGGAPVLTHDLGGTGQTIQVTGGTANATLGFPTTLQTGTGDAANSSAVTAAEIDTWYDANYTGSTASVAAGAVVITSGSTGPASSLQVSGGTLNTLLGFSTTIVNGTATSGTNTLQCVTASEGSFGNNYTVTPTRQDVTATTLGATVPSGGPVTQLTVVNGTRLRRGDTLKITNGTDERFVVEEVNGTTVTVTSVTPAVSLPSGTAVIQELLDLSFFESGNLIARFTSLRMSPLAGRSYVGAVIVSEDDPDALLDVVDAGLTPGPSVDPRPSTLTDPQPFSGGSDGDPVVDTDYVGASATRLGMYALRRNRYNEFAIPGQATPTVHSGMETFVALQGNHTIMGIMTPPQGTANATAAVTYLQSTANISSDSLAMYFPWIKITDSQTGLLADTAPEGHILGCYARTDREKNIAKAPAGTTDGKMFGARKATQLIEEQDSEANTLYPAGINPIITAPEGILIWGSRTLGQSDQLRQVSKRRTMNFFKRSIESETRFIVFEGNDTESRGKWRRAVQAFCLRNWKAGLLDGDSAAEAFYVICDESNNPPSVVNAGFFRGKVGLRFKNTAEFVVYEFEQDTRAIQAELAAAGLA